MCDEKTEKRHGLPTTVFIHFYPSQASLRTCKTTYTHLLATRYNGPETRYRARDYQSRARTPTIVV